MRREEKASLCDAFLFAPSINQAVTTARRPRTESESNAREADEHHRPGEKLRESVTDVLSSVASINQAVTTGRPPFDFP
jgi:hypothetical protein